MHGKVPGLADGGAKPPDYPDYRPSIAEIPAGMGCGAGSGLNPQPGARALISTSP